MFLRGEREEGKTGWGGWLRGLVQGSVGVTAGCPSAQSEPSIVGLIQAGDGRVLNPVFSIQMFLVVWLKGKEGGGGLHNPLSLFPSCVSSLCTLRHLKTAPVFPY